MTSEVRPPELAHSAMIEARLESAFQQSGVAQSADGATTRDLILQTAEGLFAERGYRGVSVRSITRECGLNSAAIHYHFGSKQAVLEEIFACRCGPMNAERIRRLEACRERPGAPLLEQILEAYLRPSLCWPHDPEGARNFLRLRAILAHEDGELTRQLIGRHFNDVTNRFVQALIAALPELPQRDIYWRIHFLHGVQYYTLLNPGRLRELSGGLCDASDTEESLREMVSFFAGAFRLPASSAALELVSTSIDRRGRR